MRFTAFTAASALATLATAQTWTECNPMEKDCPNDPAMAKTFETNFKAGKDAVKGWKQTAGSLTYGADGAAFTVAKKGDAPTIQSEGFLHFGYVEVKMKAAPGQGIISSIVLQSQNLDEVDWEWIGGREGITQGNYFGKGNTTTYDRMEEFPVATTQSEFHTYALNWTAEALTWIIDGTPVRTLKYADANGGKNYPQTPCNVRLGNWPGGDSENEGTVQWAGGKVDYTKAPFTMTVESIKVINYSPGTEYKWTDKSGSYESIEVIGAGNTEGAPQNSAVIQPSATASGKPLASEVNTPGSGKDEDDSNPGSAKSTPCTTSGVQTTAVPVAGGQGSGFNYPTGAPKPSGGAAGTPPSDDDEEDDKPCECGTATVIVTGPPPAATFTTQYPALPPSSIIAIPSVSSVKVPIVSSVAPPQPPVPSAPYPTSGLIIETRPPPSAPIQTATGVVPTPSLPIPSRNATTSAPAQFTGAASHNRASMMVGAFAGAVLLSF